MLRSCNVLVYKFEGIVELCGVILNGRTGTQVSSGCLYCIKGLVCFRGGIF